MAKNFVDNTNYGFTDAGSDLRSVPFTGASPANCNNCRTAGIYGPYLNGDGIANKPASTSYGFLLVMNSAASSFTPDAWQYFFDMNDGKIYYRWYNHGNIGAEWGAWAAFGA